ncbi:hypothetical protein GCM10025864_21520 [Luteimicrobium album]|uniref:Uncharacterized protein n=1 Tax=Luteimicrobium album TaxID=1054550 RepID=A0ABQ6I2J7_9MICO|nr:hypothetical protein GCM10025864_21520 [Luteimicrobium album]
MSERQTVTLDGVPGLGGLYARGLAGSAVARVRPSRGDLVLPDVALRVAGVGTGDPALRERLAAYDRVVGEPASDALPAGFVHVLAFPVATALMTRDDFPLPCSAWCTWPTRCRWCDPSSSATCWRYEPGRRTCGRTAGVRRWTW